jgi:hypothetical protein
MLKGNNMIKLNLETVCTAVEEYLHRQLTKEAAANLHVTDVHAVYENTTRFFHVSTSDVEPVVPA